MYILYSLSILALFLPGHEARSLIADNALTTSKWLIDGTTTVTTNAEADERAVVITFKQPMRFTTVMISHVSEFKLFGVTYNFKPCPYQRWSRHDSHLTGVYCDLDKPVYHLRISGLMKYATEVDFYFGALISPGQFTNQSSDYREGNKVYSSDLAVDKNDNTSFASGSCTHTGVPGPKPAKWSLYFQTPQPLMEVMITNRDSNQERLAGFILETYSSTGELVETYKEPGVSALHYLVPLTQKKVPVSYLSVMATNSENVLTICEFKAYTEYCPTYKWGDGCSQDCKCNPLHYCEPAYGRCTSPCPVGFYGITCDLMCSSNCGNEGCTVHEGHCWNCVAGRMGEVCDIECAGGKYGPNCAKSCSDVCINNECDPKTGGCLTCREGMFGPECSMRCSENCADGKCEPSSGRCFSCKAGLYKELCDTPCRRNCTDYTCNRDTGFCGTECPPGRYGEKCTEKCPDHCDACDGVKCFRCSRDFYGRNCSIICPETCQQMTCEKRGKTEQPQEETYYHWLIMGIIGGFVVVVVAYFVIGLKVFL